MTKQTFTGVYGSLDFPDYEYREYPKHMGFRLQGGKPVEVIAANKAEEDEILENGGLERDPVAAAEAKVTVANKEKELLEARIAELEAKLAAKPAAPAPAKPSASPVAGLPNK